MAIITESIDDLVREAESLKSRLEEERAKFNDMERMSNLTNSFLSNRLALFFS